MKIIFVLLNMKIFKKNRTISNLCIFLSIVSIFLSSCGTIIGGSTYYAHIIVPKHPNAEIYLNNERVGTGSVSVEIKRKNANKLQFKIKEEGCMEENKYFTTYSIRGFATAGSILIGSPYFIGLIVDLVTGSLIKPNTAENGIEKEDYKNFSYVLNYTGCAAPIKSVPKVVSKKIEFNEFPTTIFLLNGGNSKGKIIERMAGDSLKLKNSFGSIFIYSNNEIDFIKTDKNGIQNDMVYLKNGQKITGVIIEETPYKNLKIIIENGTEMILKMEEIERVVKVN